MASQGATEGEGDDESHLDAEGLLERERRWMEAIFAASRPDDLRYTILRYIAERQLLYSGEFWGGTKVLFSASRFVVATLALDVEAWLRDR